MNKIIFGGAFDPVHKGHINGEVDDVGKNDRHYGKNQSPKDLLVCDHVHSLHDHHENYET